MGAAAAGLALLGWGCAPAKSPLRVGINPWPGYEFINLAEELGFYRDLGLNLQIVEFTSLGDTRRAFERNQIDVGAGTAVELLTAAGARQNPVQAFFLTDVSVGADYLIGHPKLARISDLKGRKVAVEPGTLNLLLLYLALQEAGLKLADVQMVPLSQTSMPGAFLRQEVDAVVVYPPVADQFLAQVPGQARVLYDSSRCPDAIIDILYAQRSLIEQRAGELAALVAGFERARDYTQRHPDDAYARMAARTDRRRADFERDMQGLRFIPLAEQKALFQPGGRVDITLHESLQALRDSGLALALGQAALVTPAILQTSPAP